jgi:hypothetical protein
VQGTGTPTVAAVVSSTGTLPASETTGALVVGDVVFGVLAIEGNVALTFDTDTLNGNWSTAQNTVANTGTGNTSVRAASQWKEVSGTGAQTWDVSAASQDRASGTVVVREAAAAVTGTADGTWGAWSATVAGLRTVLGVAAGVWGAWTATATEPPTILCPPLTVATIDDGQTGVATIDNGTALATPIDNGAAGVATIDDGTTTVATIDDGQTAVEVC